MNRTLKPCLHRTGGGIWLNAEYEEKEKAKRLGAEWDSKVKCWYWPQSFVVSGKHVELSEREYKLLLSWTLPAGSNHRRANMFEQLSRNDRLRNSSSDWDSDSVNRLKKPVPVIPVKKWLRDGKVKMGTTD